MTPISTTYSNLIGVPYEKKNCWDIAVDFYKQIFGVELKHIYEGPTPDKNTTKNLIYTNMGDFHAAVLPQFGDIIVMKIQGIESHIGIYLGHGKLLHTHKSTGSVVDRLNRWEKLVVGYYRVKINDKN